MPDTRENNLPKFIKLYTETPSLASHSRAANLAARNPEKHLSFSFSSAWENS